VAVCSSLGNVSSEIGAPIVLLLELACFLFHRWVVCRYFPFIVVSALAFVPLFISH
jgi:hypothetical protein